MNGITKSAILLVFLFVLTLGFVNYMEMKTELKNVKEKYEELINNPVPAKTDHRVKYTKTDMFCLAKNIYHESKTESYLGRLAVAQVTINRLHTGRWGKSICDVVMSPYQFSWTIESWQKWTRPSGKLWDESVAIAEEVLQDGVRLVYLREALYFHADYVNPKWNKQKERVVQIGAHIFYKYPKKA